MAFSLSQKKNTAGERELAVNISIWNQAIPIELVCVGGWLTVETVKAIAIRDLHKPSQISNVI